MKTKIKQNRPERSLKAVAAEEKKKSKHASIDKRFTAMKAAGEGGDGEFGGIFTPTDEQLAKINEFTRRPVGADEVVCFSTMSCNDMIDRDNDRFTSQCVTDFAKLEGPLSPVGKSFMVSHDYTKLPVGRIFGVDTKTVEGVKFLTNDVYMPKTDANKSYIENLEFGIYWAVSVGVMLEESSCSVCASPMVGNFWVFCLENGHEKGLYYDPKSEDKDEWGWAEPVDPATKNAVLCHRDLSAPKDFYELSQCFLGAQYDAELAKGSMKGIVKAASLGKVPILNLSTKEAEELPLEHVSDQLRDAFAKGFTVSHEDDGTVKWTDDNDLVWIFDPTEGEVMSLGEAKGEDDDEESNENGEEDDNGEGLSQEQDGDADALGSDDAIGVEDGAGSSDASGEGEHDSTSSDTEGVDINAAGEDDDEDSEEEDEDDDDSDEDEDEEGGDSTDQNVLAAVRSAALPEEVVMAVRSAKANKLSAFVRAAADHIAELAPKAVLGDKFVEAKRAEAIKWYVKAKQSSDEPVKTDRINKLLDLCGSDIDLIEEVIEEQKEIAQAKFPASVRRSTVQRDINEPQGVEKIELDRSTEDKVRKLHA